MVLCCLLRCQPLSLLYSPYSAAVAAVAAVAPVRLVTKRPTDGPADSGDTRSDTPSSVEVHGSVTRSRTRTLLGHLGLFLHSYYLTTPLSFLDLSLIPFFYIPAVRASAAPKPHLITGHDYSLATLPASAVTLVPTFCFASNSCASTSLNIHIRPLFF
jgi:hypothetical protein